MHNYVSQAAIKLRLLFEPNLYLYENPSNLAPVNLLAYTTYEDGTECSNHRYVKSPKRKNTAFRTRREFEIKGYQTGLSVGAMHSKVLQDHSLEALNNTLSL
jgi:hypothetical protein